MMQRAAAAHCVAAAANCNMQQRPAAANRPAAQACRADSADCAD